VVDRLDDEQGRDCYMSSNTTRTRCSEDIPEQGVAQTNSLLRGRG
jgi:hypothetical protein